jgi:serine protease Do
MAKITTHTPDTVSISKNQQPWRRAFFGLLIAAIILFSIGGGAFGTWLLLHNNNPTTISATEDGNKTVTQQESDIAAVAAKANPSVVSITTSTQSQTVYGNTVSGAAAGTGILISSNGYIMTNNHVIDGATSVSVIDSDGNVYDNVKVIGRDPLNDAAFLKVTSDKTFIPATIGDSSTVHIGQQVVAIGNALGQYQNTVTSGILSATGRPLTASAEDGSSSESLVDLLQTDASINAGNSGGPLLNLAGQVIGMNTAVASDANGIGFAIPINAEKGVLAGVIANGTIQRGFLGVNYVGITPEVAHQYNLPVSAGAYVYVAQGSPVSVGGPADKAGIKQGDIIQKVNNETVGQQGGLSTLLGEYKPDDKLTLTILRDNKTITVDVTLGTYAS